MAAVVQSMMLTSRIFRSKVRAFFFYCACALYSTREGVSTAGQRCKQSSSASAEVKMSSSSESAGEEQDATGPTHEEQRDHFSTDGQEGIFNYQKKPLAV